MSNNPKPRDSYREQRACVNCKFSEWHDKWDDLLCKKWSEPTSLVPRRVDEHGMCDLWEGEV